MNQSQFLAITCNSLKAREKSRVNVAIGFGFASHWLKNWRESFKPITKRSNRNHVITFDSHLKTALSDSLLLDTLLSDSYDGPQGTCCKQKTIAANKKDALQTKNDRCKQKRCAANKKHALQTKNMRCKQKTCAANKKRSLQTKNAVAIWPV